jgi:hypothetical protein
MRATKISILAHYLIDRDIISLANLSEDDMNTVHNLEYLQNLLKSFSQSRDDYLGYLFRKLW